MEDNVEYVKVWDPLVRFFHWALVVAVALAFLAADDLLGLHLLAGYTVLGLILFRLLWGLVGPRHARFSNFLFRPRAVVAYLKDLVLFRAKRYLGHGPAGGAMVASLLLSLLLTTFSGLALYGGREFAGPLRSVMAGLDDRWTGVAEAFHEFFAGVTAFLAFVHIAGVLFSSLVHRENLIMAMFTGYKKREGHLQPASGTAKDRITARDEAVSAR
ncbi:MAG TPA: cytochrome b/b6 domain-containing protein [Nitrospiria bacterium]|nr:cytochrome b/b6 domain-containing protein [Nitrospiria bacterium]